MKSIDCNTDAARALLLAQPNARIRNIPNNALWRIDLDDCVAIAFKDSVLPQGKNPQRIAELLRPLNEALLL